MFWAAAVAEPHPLAEDGAVRHAAGHAVTAWLIHDGVSKGTCSVPTLGVLDPSAIFPVASAGVRGAIRLVAAETTSYPVYAPRLDVIAAQVVVDATTLAAAESVPLAAERPQVVSVGLSAAAEV